jgi:hypothetical protein
MAQARPSDVGLWGQSRRAARAPKMTLMTDAVEKGLVIFDEQ